MEQPIDFVVTWVDGSDPAWLAERARYSSSGTVDNASERYRSMDTMRYWFRGVERFCPWVRTVHFVSWGHTPEWLDLDAPKLHVVKHGDFIPSEYLPTFNSNAIELNFHRMEGLSEQFVSFNDDVFVTAPLEPEQFFKDGRPCDMLALQPVIANASNPVMSYIYLNNSLLLSRHFTKRSAFARHPLDFLHVGYPPLYFFYNALELLYPQITGFYTPHGPASLLKGTFRAVWDAEPEAMERTASQRFRSSEDVSIYALQEWQKLSGNFNARNVTKRLGFFDISEDLPALLACIRKQSKALVCINDNPCEGFSERCAAIRAAFEEILPEPSAFERA